MLDLNSHLYYKGHRVYNEGYCEQIQEQISIFNEIIEKNKIINILEIGFHAGHSSYVFLNHPTQHTNVISFDLNEHPYTMDSKEFIDYKFPNRHTLISGNTMNTLPIFIKNNINKYSPDLIFIDGGHEFYNCFNDLILTQLLANKNTICIIDDVVQNKEFIAEWNIGPNLATQYAIQFNIIYDYKFYDFQYGRGMNIAKIRI